MIYKRLRYSLKVTYKELVFFFAVNAKPLLRLFYSYENDEISKVISNFSKITPNLKVIQVGANDGFNNDPIHRFILRDNWQGVLIEPQKTTYTKYLKRIYRNSNRITTINAAMGYKNGELPLYKISFSNGRWATGLATFNKAGLEKMVADGFIDKRAQKYGIKVPNSKEDYITSEKVQVLSPTTLREKYNLGDLDLLMVDTEGFDFEIIKMFFSADFKPSLVIFEHFHLSQTELAECNTLLSSHGYFYKIIKGNTVAIQDTEKYSNIKKILQA